MLQFELWRRIVPENSHKGMLCIGCVEARLGRTLDSGDFLDAPINHMASTGVISSSRRLRDRLRRLPSKTPPACGRGPEQSVLY